MFRTVRSVLKTADTRCLQLRGKKSRADVECFLPICNVEIRKAPATNAEKCRVGSFLAAHYFTDEPTLIAADLNSTSPDASLLQYFMSLMNDNKTLYALVQESRELLGVCVAHATTPTTIYELRTLAERFGNEKARRYMQFLAQLEERNNLYNTYRVDKVWTIDILCVNRIFRRRGLAKMLMMQQKRNAQDAGFNIMRFDTANAYGQRVARSCNDMKILTSKSLSIYKDPRGVPWIQKPICEPHKSVDVLIGNLRPEVKKAEKKEPVCDDYGLKKKKS